MARLADPKATIIKCFDEPSGQALRSVTASQEESGSRGIRNQAI